MNDDDVKDVNPLRGNIHEHLEIIVSFNGVSQREECMARCKKALAARRKPMLRYQTARLNVESDMAFGLMQEENFEESEQYIKKCHKKYKEWGTEDDIFYPSNI